MANWTNEFLALNLDSGVVKIMSEKKKKTLKKPVASYNIAIDTEEQRLRRDIFRSDMEKLQLFTKMLQTNALYKRAKITHK